MYSGELAAKRNELHVLRRRLELVEQALGHHEDPALKDIEGFFTELSETMPDLIRRDYEDLKKFHREVFSNRWQRLTHEKENLRRDYDALTKGVNELAVRVDGLTRFLGDHGGLADYTALMEKLGDVRMRKQRMEDHRRLESKCKEDLNAIRVEMAEATVKAEVYLAKEREKIDAWTAKFRAYCKEVYPAKRAGLIVKNNTRENTVRWDIDFRIESDSSDGIREAKILVYDIAMLLDGAGHRMECLWHDSRLYESIEPRQKLAALTMAHKRAAANGSQYVVTLNYEAVDSMIAIANDEQKELLHKSIVLTLGDADASERLLGIDVDLDYDEGGEEAESVEEEAASE